MYSNIPIKETKLILEDILSHNTADAQTINETLNWYDTITQQNYFANNGNIILQKEGLTMEAPSSSIISEIFLQSLEQTKLPLIAGKLKLTNYFRYIDDILIVFDSSSRTDINIITKEFNSIHPKTQFTQELEREHRINYLDITIHRKPTQANISIFRKPTYTNTLIS
jgi:hypothetical protein